LSKLFWSILGRVCVAATLIVVPARAVKAEAGFSGMQVQGMKQEIANALGLKKATGVLIRDIALGEPANQAGLMRGDLIVKFAGKDIDTFQRLIEAVRGTKPKQQVKVTVLRKGGQQDLTLKLGDRPQAWRVTKGAVINLPGIGITLAAITKKIRKRFSIRWGSIGVLVTLIDPAVESAMQLIRGDIIVQVNQEIVWKPEQVVAMYKAAQTKGRKRLLILVERVSGFEYMLLPVK